MKRAISVALMFPARISHLQKSIHGIADFARKHEEWTFVMRPDSYTVSLESLHDWNGDGAIALVDTEAALGITRKLPFPVVNLSGALRDADLPRVMVNHRAVGRLAAEHLLECGFRRFAFYGVQNLWYVELRREGFVERVEQEGYHCATLMVDPARMHGNPLSDGQKKLEQWLSTIAVPVGLLACDDHHARMVSQACSSLKLDVPSNVGIIGVDNQEIICEFCEPPLSSVSRNDYEVGFQAAALLDRIISDKRSAKDVILVPPGDVVRRDSTDIVGVNDVFVTAAIRYIRQNIERQFGIEHLATQISVSRRYLEQKFRSQLDCTPMDYLFKLRIERAKQMLAANQQMKISHVARACGFTNSLQLRRAFHRIIGVSPQKYRQTL